MKLNPNQAYNSTKNFNLELLDKSFGSILIDKYKKCTTINGEHN